jgi:hypothetical protein
MWTYSASGGSAAKCGVCSDKGVADITMPGP